MSYQDAAFQKLNCQRLQIDEVRSFVYCKAESVTPEIAQNNQSAGDAWLWCAMDADTKLVPCWAIGPRDLATARDFINDLAGRLTHRVQLSTDALRLYVSAVDEAFGQDVAFAQIHKIYGKVDSERYIERHNLSVRMTNRRLTRLTNAFSKKIESHVAAVALGYFAYNFTKD